MQDKRSASATLDRLDLPQPPTTVVTSVDELLAWSEFPVYTAKTPIGTSDTGVRRVDDRGELAACAPDASPRGLVLQLPIDGPLAMVQSVFDHGRLVASHANLRVREGEERTPATSAASTTVPSATT